MDQASLLHLLMGTSSDQAAYKLIIPLDFSSVKSVPDSFVWLETDGVQSDVHGLSIPVIDLMDPNALNLIADACETFGVFQLTGHGIPRKTMEDVESETRRLFELPVDRKLKALRSPDGWSGYGIVQIQPLFSTLMWHEGFTVFGSPVDHAKLLWPDDYQHFCDTIEDYQRQMKALAEKLMHMFFKALSIDPEENMKWSHDPSNNCDMALQLNSYPPCPEPSRTLGMAPHTDTSLVTILQAKTSGLQVFKDGVGWIPVEPIPDALVVNLGDLTRILSNGRFVSVLHQVVVKPVQRYSMGFFFRPPRHLTLSPVLSDDSEAPLYRPVTVKEYTDLKLKHIEKAFSFIEI